MAGLIKRCLAFLQANALPLAALAVAALAMLGTHLQVQNTYYHNRLSVVPVVGVKIDFVGDDGHYSMVIENKGLGPAILKGFDVKFGSNTPDTAGDLNLANLAAPAAVAHGVPNPVPGLHAAHVGYNTVLKPGEAIVILRAKKGDQLATQIFAHVANGVEIGVCYRSLYGDEFYVKTLESQENTKSCTDRYSIRLLGRRMQFKWPWQSDPLTFGGVFGDK